MVTDLSQDNENFNRAFQTALDMPETNPRDTFYKYVRLAQLSTDFVRLASNYGKIIVSELFLPQKDRTIKTDTRLNAKGFAGGQKYLIRSILFKLASDTKMSDTPLTYLYGGLQGKNTELAQKAAGHELRGATNYFRFYNKGLSVPMQAVVDYHGFRLIAMPYLPLQKDGLIYGSDNCGVDVHNKYPPFNNIMKEVAQELHLAEHYCQGKILHAAGDVEGHYGTCINLHYTTTTGT